MVTLVLVNSDLESCECTCEVSSLTYEDLVVNEASSESCTLCPELVIVVEHDGVDWTSCEPYGH